MADMAERPDGAGQPPAPGGTAGWLPPVPPGPQPGPPPGWRISPKAVDLAPGADAGPQPWADAGNPNSGIALGLSVSAFGLLFVLGLLAIPLAVAGSILGAISRGRIKRGETRQGRVEADVALVVGIGTTVIATLSVIAYLLR